VGNHDALSPLCFWHPVGPHAGESLEEIVSRKQSEIAVHGYTLWSFAPAVVDRVLAWRSELRRRGLTTCAVVCCGDATVDQHDGVDRLVGERRVPQGSVGRVTRSDGDQLEVTVVGVGVVRYAPDELSPRRVGQVLFAHRRAGAWDALRSCVVLDAIVGSRAWASPMRTRTSTTGASSRSPSRGRRASCLRPRTS
jgi:hypothetical protein